MEAERAASQGTRPDGLPNDVDTIICVDVDGVLNVGVADQGNQPVLVNDMNLAFAQRNWSKREGHPMGKMVEMLMAVSEKRLNEGSETFAELAAKNPSQVSEVLVGRLAEILEAAGPRAISVLASTWQAPRNKARLQSLEKKLSEVLGRDFHFDAVTGFMENNNTAAGRLQAIAYYVKGAAGPGGVAAAAARRGELRVLVMDDFFIKPLTGTWVCGGRPIDSAATVEEYIREQMPPSSDASVKLIHTYAAWTTDRGIHLQCGVGLAEDDVRSSKAFLARAPKANHDLPAGEPRNDEAAADRAGHTLLPRAIGPLIGAARQLQKPRCFGSAKTRKPVQIESVYRLTRDNVDIASRQQGTSGDDPSNSSSWTGTGTGTSTRTSSSDSSSPATTTPRASDGVQVPGKTEGGPAARGSSSPTAPCAEGSPE